MSEVTLTVPLVGVAGCLANSDCNKVTEEKRAETLLCEMVITKAILLFFNYVHYYLKVWGQSFLKN